MGSGITIERVTSPLIILGIILFLIQVATAGHVGMYLHAAIGLYAAFYVFCIPVYLGMVGGLSGGHPRRLPEAMLPAAAALAMLSSALYTVRGDLPRIELALGFLLSLLFTFLQVRGHGSSIYRRLALALPFIAGLIIVLRPATFIDLTVGLVFYNVLLMPISIALVMLYSKRVSDAVIAVYVITVLVGSFLYAYTGARGFLAVPLVVSLGALLSGRVWELASKPVIGDAALAHLGLMLVAPLALYMLVWGDILHAAHIALLGGAVPMVLAQAPNIAPVLVAATWHRRRGRMHLSIALLLLASLLWGTVPIASQILLAGSVAWALYALNPSPRRIMLILAYGTEKGYMEAYLDASKG